MEIEVTGSDGLTYTFNTTSSVVGVMHSVYYLNNKVLNSSLNENLAISGGRYETIESIYETIDANVGHIEHMWSFTELQPYFSSEQSQSIASTLYSASIY